MRPQRAGAAGAGRYLAGPRRGAWERTREHSGGARMGTLRAGAHPGHVPVWVAWVVMGAALLAALLVPLGAAAAPTGAPATVSVFATGLDAPRGLTFGPDGSLYVAEGGQGGTNSSAFLQNNPVQKPSPYDFEPDGDFYSLEQVGGDLYAVESNHGELDKITLSGGVSRVADVSATLAHTVPTAATYHDGNFYVGTLLPFPPTSTGQAKILKITPQGQVSVFAPGLTTVLGVAFDAQGRLYALETISVAGEMPTPGTGRVV